MCLSVQLGDFGLARRVYCDPHAALPPVFPVFDPELAATGPPAYVDIDRLIVVSTYRYVFSGTSRLIVPVV